MAENNSSELSIEYSFKAGNQSNSKSSSAKSTSAEAPSTRWWESYAVRYFIGFVVGAICVATLVIDLGLLKQAEGFFLQTFGLNTTAQSSIKPDWTSVLLILCLLGFCYCYVASTPITVLHFGRYGHGRLDAHARHFWFGWSLAIIFSSIFGFPSGQIFLFFNGLLFFWGWIASRQLIISPQYEIEKAGSDIEKRKNAENLLPNTLKILIEQSLWWALIVWGGHSLMMWCISIFHPQVLAPHVQALWLFSAPFFWIGISQYFVLGRLFTEHEKIYAFYANLFEARRQENAKDVRDSYSHLREHSNAVFIVVVELSILACLLALRRTVDDGNNSSTPITMEYLKWGFCGLAIWMLPTVFLWGRANAFEKQFATYPERFLSREAGEESGQIDSSMSDPRSGINR